MPPKTFHFEWTPEFALLLRKMRRGHYYTQSELANASGCTIGRISAVENGAQMPSLALLERIGAALGTTFSSQFPADTVFIPSHDLLTFRRSSGRFHGVDIPRGQLWSARHGHALRLARMLAGYSALELSKVIGSRSSTSINAWERCQQAPQYQLLLSLDHALSSDFHSLCTPDMRIVTTKDEHRLAMSYGDFKPCWTQEDGQHCYDARVDVGCTSVTRFAHALGCAQSTISDVERCANPPSRSLLARIDELLGTSFVEDVHLGPLRKQLEETLRSLDVYQEVAS